MDTKNLKSIAFLVCNLIFFSMIGLTYDTENSISYLDRIDMLVQEFLDVNQNPKKVFKNYIEELIVLLKEIPQADGFRNQLEKIKNTKNGTLAGLTFLQYKKLFPQDLFRKVTSLGKDKLLEIFYKRINPSKLV